MFFFTFVATVTWLVLTALFVQMWIDGTVRITEPSWVIRLIETLGFFALTCWGMDRLVGLIKKEKSSKK